MVIDSERDLINEGVRKSELSINPFSIDLTNQYNTNYINYFENKQRESAVDDDPKLSSIMQEGKQHKDGLGKNVKINKMRESRKTVCNNMVQEEDPIN